MMSFSLAVLLLVVGVGLLGGAIFGHLRGRRLTLLGATVAIWTVAAVLFLSGCQALPSVDMPTATPAATAFPDSPLPTPTVQPEQPEGTVVFASDRSGNFDIWVMDLAEPDSPKRVTDNPAPDVEPRWSPDGSRILFSSGRDDPNGVNELYTMAADGSDQKRLLAWEGSYEWGAVFSPDGKWVAFTTTKDGKYEIYVIPSGGDGEPINLTQNDFLDSYPDWSADGRWMVFASDRGGNWDVWKMDVQACLTARQNGVKGEDAACDAVRLTDNPEDDFYPRWSPDGSQVVFESRREADRDIYLMDADGGNQTRITTMPERDAAPFWADDGKFILYSHDYGAQFDLHSVRADGSNDQRLMNVIGEDRFGDWRP